MLNKILIVDDESAFRSGFSRALNKVCNFNGVIKTAANGNDAIKEITNCRYDVCFLDVNLPDIDGLDVMKEIKKLSPHTRVIIMTASVLDNAMKSDIDRDAYMFLPKPIELDMVKALMSGEMEAVSGAPLSKNFNTIDKLNEEKREHIRMSCSKFVTYSISIFYDWQFRSDNTAEIINISHGGVGLITSFPVTTGNVITFTEGFPEKKGIVRWSTKNTPKYRAGIKFI